MTTAAKPTDDEFLPEWMTIAHAEWGRGVIEVAGVSANPRILLYLASTGLKGTKLALTDSTAWCSAFMCWVLERAGFRTTRSAAARSWLKWGAPLDHPRPGCIVVFDRSDPNNPNAAHVAFYTGNDVRTGYINVLGGNQKNRVCVAPYKLSDVIGYRWPVTP
jgi:uncharacterized protein (TIGR02594 family)